MSIRKLPIVMFLATLLIVLICGTTIGGVMADSGGVSGSGSLLAQHLKPFVQMSALQLSDGVRYSLVLNTPDDLAMPRLRVLIKLPPASELLGVLQTPGYTRFAGVETGDTLVWGGQFAAGDYVDAFTFNLKRVPQGAFNVRLIWEGDQPGDFRYAIQPAFMVANAPEGEVTLDAAGTGNAFWPIGDTGVLVSIPAGTLAKSLVVHVRQLGPENNPPTAVGDLWWCSLVEVKGLPEGTHLRVRVPLRQPLPAHVPVTLFRRDTNGQWGQLADTGRVSLDGQYVDYVHLGGMMATGIGSGLKPKVPTNPPPPNPPPQNPAAPQVTLPINAPQQNSAPAATVASPQPAPPKPTLAVHLVRPTSQAAATHIPAAATRVVVRATQISVQATHIPPTVAIKPITPTKISIPGTPAALTPTIAIVPFSDTQQTTETGPPLCTYDAIQSGALCDTGDGGVLECDLGGLNCEFTDPGGTCTDHGAFDGQGVTCNSYGGDPGINTPLEPPANCDTCNGNGDMIDPLGTPPPGGGPNGNTGGGGGTGGGKPNPTPTINCDPNNGIIDIFRCPDPDSGSGGHRPRRPIKAQH